MLTLWRPMRRRRQSSVHALRTMGQLAENCFGIYARFESTAGQVRNQRDGMQVG